MSVSMLFSTSFSNRPRPKHAKRSTLASAVAPVAVGGALTAGVLVGVASPASAAATGGQLAALRNCESGGNYSINTGNGYYGAYQFSAQTWRGVGFSGLPHQASPSTQDAAARALQARSGWGQWPACSRKLGLNNSGGGGTSGGSSAQPRTQSQPQAQPVQQSSTRSQAPARASRSARVAAVPAYVVPKTAPLFDRAFTVRPLVAGSGKATFLPQVKAWQARMDQRGWNIEADGFYGPKSAAVAQRFATEKKLLVRTPGVLNRGIFDAAWKAPVT